jgi:hypothetical protein
MNLSNQFVSDEIFRTIKHMRSISEAERIVSKEVYDYLEKAISELCLRLEKDTPTP